MSRHLPWPKGRLFIRKSIGQVRQESAAPTLKRTLGAVNLVFLGVGCIIGAGIFVMTGSAAANFAGPAVMLSFVIAGFACAFAGLCYAELAAAIPVAGSAYTYAYTSMGELFAWVMGWLLVLEYGIAGSTVSVGWSGYLVSLLNDFGVGPPAEISHSFIQSVADGHGRLSFHSSANANLIAAAGILSATALLVRGVRESITFTNVVVLIKVGVLAAFVVFGAAYVQPHNWTPFIPPNQGGFAYGLPGVFRAASVIFFAYVGFEAVSTAAAEAKNPQRDMPIGILGSLIICTAIYMAVAAVLTGIVPYRMLGVAEPLAYAVDRMAMPWFSLVLKVGAIAGLSSVMLVLIYAQSRVFFAMARDGLLPAAFSVVHRRFRTPWIGTIVLGIAMAITSSMLPITILGDLVSLGTSCAFGIVCFSMLWLRKTQPDLPRPFRAPFGVLTPVLGMAFAVVMAAPLVIDIVLKALGGDLIPALILGGYLSLGASIYALYGFRHSRLANSLEAAIAPPPSGDDAALAKRSNGRP